MKKVIFSIQKDSTYESENPYGKNVVHAVGNVVHAGSIDFQKVYDILKSIRGSWSPDTN